MATDTSSINSNEPISLLQQTTPAPALLAALGEGVSAPVAPVNASGSVVPVSSADVKVEVSSSDAGAPGAASDTVAVVAAIGTVAGAVNNAVGGAAGAVISDATTVATAVVAAAESDSPTISKVRQLLQDPTLAPASRRLLERLEGRLPEAITPDNLMIVTKMAIEAVELLIDLKGADKKTAVIDVITRLNGVLVADEQRTLLSIVITEVIPNTIDLVVSASKGNMDINKVKTCCVSFFKLFK
jgi:hypothetical protein